jgi:hypothetical protein
MGDFMEVMTGVSDASVFIDAANAAGVGLGGFSGTVVIPINDVGASIARFASAILQAHISAMYGDGFAHFRRCADVTAVASN